MRGRTRRTAALATALTLVVAALGLLGTTGPAAGSAASPVAPTGLTADGGVPRLAWDRVPGASGYEVEVSTSPSFSPRTWSRSTTVNAQVVPEVALPAGELSWRVRAKQGSTLGDWATGTVTVGEPDVPSLLGPEDGARISQPDAPPLLRWSPVAGADGYVLEVGDDPEFTDPTRSTVLRPRGTSWVLASAQLPGKPAYWRVRAELGAGVLGGWSRVGSYDVDGLPPAVLDSPVDDAAVPVEDVVLDWAPVAGATRYDVRLSADQNFNSGVTSARTVATRWSPATTVVNEQYFWQVRPIDALGTETPWSDVPTWKFRRHWPRQPRPVHPADGQEVGDPLFLQWEPVRLASSYRVLISTRDDFPDVRGLTVSCATAATTLVVDPVRCALPTLGGERFFWKVQAVDAPQTATLVTDVISAPVRSFVYRPERATPTAPADGASVEVPTMRWAPAPRPQDTTGPHGAQEYEVTWTSTVDGTTRSATTTGTSYTPTTRLVPGVRYRWDVRTVSAAGRTGTGTAPERQWTFTVAEPAVSPAGPLPEPLEPVVAPSDRFPTLRWSPVEGADHYRLRLRDAGEQTYRVMDTRYGYPAGEQTGLDELVTGTRFWSVEAWSRSALIAVGPESRFTITPSAAVRGHRAGLTGVATGDPATTCDMGLPDTCQDLDGTPVVRWDPVPGASAYRVQVTLDRERTSLLPSPLHAEFWTTTPMWAHDRLLPDQQAGSAYFVSVRPCKALDLRTCAATSHADHAFNKRSNAVELVAPADGAAVFDDVTLDWRDYLETNQDPARATDVTGVHADVEARGYEVEVSTDATFTDPRARVVAATVDQTTFTAPGTTLPEGDSFWRVRAVDGSGNGLVWSTGRRIVKRSPAPEPLTPAPDDSVDGGQSLRWGSLPFAADYRVQVLRTGTSAPVAQGVVAQTAFTPATPLAAGDGYTWRVQRVDASGRDGEWSAAVPFSVRAAAPRLQAPAAEEDVAPSGSLFTWGDEPGAARYRFERRVAGAAAASETASTKATGWAPVTAIAAGRHEWRVVAVDAAGKDLGASAWRGFAVRSAPTAAAPAITGTWRVGTSLRAAEPAWDMPVDPDAGTVQWLRNGQPVPGATGLQYDTTTADLGTLLAVRFTAGRDGWADGSVTTAGTRVTAGVAPTLQAEPVVRGAPRAGSELGVDPPDWDMADVTTTYQWLRDGAALRGATGPTYVVGTGDIGRAVSVRVTGRRTGYDDGVATSSPVTIAAGEAPTALTPPGITGPGSTLRVGDRATATAGEWSLEGLRAAYQWLRDGTAIAGATGSAYTVTAADAGRLLGVRVTMTRTGYDPGSAVSPTRQVAKLASTTAASLSRTSARPRQAVQVAVTVTTATRGVTPGGTVGLMLNGRQVASSRLKAARTTLRYVPRAVGTLRLTVRYVGQDPVAASTSRPLVLRVRR